MGVYYRVAWRIRETKNPVSMSYPNRPISEIKMLGNQSRHLGDRAANRLAQTRREEGGLPLKDTSCEYLRGQFASFENTKHLELESTVSEVEEEMRPPGYGEAQTSTVRNHTDTEDRRQSTRVVQGPVRDPWVKTFGSRNKVLTSTENETMTKTLKNQTGLDFDEVDLFFGSYPSSRSVEHQARRVKGLCVDTARLLTGALSSDFGSTQSDQRKGHRREEEKDEEGEGDEGDEPRLSIKDEDDPELELEGGPVILKVYNRIQPLCAYALAASATSLTKIVDYQKDIHHQFGTSLNHHHPKNTSFPPMKDQRREPPEVLGYGILQVEVDRNVGVILLASSYAQRQPASSP
ncbi:hypothetical protein BKA60DRAFT_535899 [Fusarium oxysporum]|nr:hypothetical protein BKA60DRAFT_535899 [Fusarium oxysporum]